MTESELVTLNADHLLEGYRATKQLGVQNIFLEGVKHIRTKAENALRSENATQTGLGEYWVAVCNRFDAMVQK